MTQPWEFEEPVAQGDRFTAEEAQNRRLIVVPTEYVPQIRTARGDIVDAIRINVVNLDDQANTYWGALWFGNKLIQTFKSKIGKLFLGYISKQQVGGGFSGWVFTSLTADQATTTMAQRFLAANPQFMETCQGDVRMAQANAARPQPAMQPQQQQQQQGQWQQAGGGYEVRNQFQAPSQQQRWPQPASQPPPPPAPPQWGNQQQAGPPPVTPPLPPLPPQTQADPWPQPPGQAQLQGNGQPPGVIPDPTDQAPGSPAPVGSSVMERLRAQRDAQQSSPPAQDPSQLPF